MLLSEQAILAKIVGTCCAHFGNLLAHSIVLGMGINTINATDSVVIQKLAFMGATSYCGPVSTNKI